MTSSSDPDPTESESAPAIELPALQEGQLDGQGVAAYLGDLEACAENLSVRYRAEARGKLHQASGLEELTALLGGGTIWGVQLSYGFKGKAWIDTLMRTPEGFRIVRVEAPPLMPTGLAP